MADIMQPIGTLTHRGPNPTTSVSSGAASAIGSNISCRSFCSLTQSLHQVHFWVSREPRYRRSIEHANPESLQQRRASVHAAAPALDIAGVGIGQPTTMQPMPVHTAVQSHVITDQHDRICLLYTSPSPRDS